MDHGFEDVGARSVSVIQSASIGPYRQMCFQRFIDSAQLLTATLSWMCFDVSSRSPKSVDHPASWLAKWNNPEWPIVIWVVARRKSNSGWMA